MISVIRVKIKLGLVYSFTFVMMGVMRAFIDCMSIVKIFITLKHALLYQRCRLPMKPLAVFSSFRYRSHSNRYHFDSSSSGENLSTSENLDLAK